MASRSFVPWWHNNFMMKEMLFANWNMLRWLRLGLAGVITMQAIEMHSWLLGALAGLLFYQAVTNTGCCATSECSVPAAKNKTGNITDIENEELKTK